MLYFKFVSRPMHHSIANFSHLILILFFFYQHFWLDGELCPFEKRVYAYVCLLALPINLFIIFAVQNGNWKRSKVKMMTWILHKDDDNRRILGNSSIYNHSAKCAWNRFDIYWHPFSTIYYPSPNAHTVFLAVLQLLYLSLPLSLSVCVCLSLPIILPCSPLCTWNNSIEIPT